MTASDRQWHLDRTIGIGHIVTTLTIAGSVFTYAIHMDRRVTVLEQQILVQAEQQSHARDAMRDLANELKLELRGLRADLLVFYRHINDRKERQ